MKPPSIAWILVFGVKKTTIPVSWKNPLLPPKKESYWWVLCDFTLAPENGFVRSLRFCITYHFEETL